MKIPTIIQGIVQAATVAMLLPLGLTLACVAFSSSGVFASPKYQLSASESYISTIVLSQPLFSIVCVWLALFQGEATREFRGGLRTIAEVVLGVLLADCAWVVGFLAVMGVLSIARGHYAHGNPLMEALIPVFFVIAVPPIVFAFLLIVAGPSCLAATITAAACRRTRAAGVANSAFGRRLAPPVLAIAYTALLAATWLAGSATFSGRAYASGIPKLLAIFWLTGASAGCAASFAAMSARVDLGWRRQIIFLFAALLGALVGFGVLFHLSMGHAGGEVWPPLFMPPG